MEADASALYFEALTLFEEVILPSLSLLASNCCLAEEIWLVLRVYPYQHRYRLYASWKKDSMERFHTQIVLNVARFFKVSFLLQSSRSTEYEGGRAEVNQTNHAAGVKGKCEAYRDDSGQTEPRVIQLIN